MQSASDMIYSQRRSCAKFFHQIYKEEGVHGLYRVSREGLMCINVVMCSVGCRVWYPLLTELW